MAAEQYRDLQRQASAEVQREPDNKAMKAEQMRLMKILIQLKKYYSARARAAGDEE
jgi:hypothetical protein